MQRYVEMSKDDQNELLLKLIKITANRESNGKDYFEMMFSGTFRAEKAEDAEHFLGIDFKEVYPEIFNTEEFQTKLGSAANDFALSKPELQNIYYELSEIESRGLPEELGMRFLFAKNAKIAKTLDKMLAQETEFYLDQELKTELYKYGLVAAYVLDKKMDEIYDAKFVEPFTAMINELRDMIRRA